MRKRIVCELPKSKLKCIKNKHDWKKKVMFLLKVSSDCYAIDLFFILIYIYVPQICYTVNILSQKKKWLDGSIFFNCLVCSNILLSE